MFASNAVIGFPTIAETGKEEAFDYIDLASKTGVKFVRILISPRPEADEVVLNSAVSVYTEICEYAKNKGVTPLIETNGIFAESKVLAEFMEKITSDNKGVLWDINHPCRFFNETAQQTFDNIGKYVKYLHLKDSVFNSDTGKIEYRPVGYGDLPIYDIIKLLANSGYDGVLSLEWTKRWCRELEDADVVFGQYVSYMQYLLGELK